MQPIEWRPVVDYEGYYEVSNIGQVRRVGKATGAVVGRIRKTWAKKSGHLALPLSRGNVITTHYVHRIVARAFIGEPEAGQEVCHNNGIPNDNRVVNLRWGTHSENMYDAVRHGVNRQAAATHCKSGHEFAGENLIAYGPDMRRRRCRTCSQIAARKVTVRKAAERIAFRAAHAA